MRPREPTRNLRQRGDAFGVLAGLIQGWGWPISGGNIAIRIATNDDRIRQFAQTIQHTGRVVADGAQIPKDPVAIDAASLLNV